MRPETLEQLLSTDERVRQYYSFVDRIRTQGQFLLDETIEKALDIRAPWTSPDIAVKAYRKQLSSSTFRLAGQPDVFSYTQIRELMRSENQEIRHHGQQAIKDGIVENRIDKFASLALNMVVGSWSIETRERGYPSPRSRRNVLNRISDEIVDALIAAVKKEGVELTRRALLLKKQLLTATGKIKAFSFVDRLAPLTLSRDSSMDANARIPWCQAVEKVKKGYASFSPVFVRLFENLLKEGRIDAAPAEGKQTGAFCSGGTPATGPFILMTHTGVKANVQTLAHEAGHAIHFLLAYEQGNLQYHPPLPLAETASLMGETIVFYHLLDQTDSPQKVLEMLIEHVDSLVGTITRQVSFDRFEELVHEARLSGIVGDEDFDQMWLQSTREFFGDEGDVFDDYAGIEKDWSTVHHFTKAPFYVYSYALADLLVGSLLAARSKNNGSDFEEKFISFLQAGDTADLETALRPFGLDPKTPSFWREAIGMRLGTAVERAERIAAELGYIEATGY
ncbi:putative oligoendopeptidase F [Neospora caninum Liverpool]|uniref:Oligoendopeptidase F, putative n=1 Tax=Neospora caninum (strain Liverpool) TaxID=572307 RepID=F0VPD0_NEOCL|nr:putative oligoendopeptidase F [Neospora caninum Liverpool]CBZ55576.1 putative oligoendopeptidase F [Neospora caninum Liverpool]CEL70318.1 TPA: oligoendopeptidase F, putative [Neospora caninum Liverpool]|eukprot:XP_003885604.1 putative oligoendopeptidase F [Neospora caninum Liverpool]